MVQYGFYFNEDRCINCKACVVACKDWYDLKPGPIKYLRIYEYEEGYYPNIKTHIRWVTCFHCSNPVCIDACPNGAIYKEEKYGAVLIDQEKCKGYRLCQRACPYGAITYESDRLANDVKANKCTMCIDRLEEGLKPVCVLACPMRALDFDTMENLVKKYGSVKQLKDLPNPSLTNPSVVFKPKGEKKKIIPYDEDKALLLLGSREPLPPIFKSLNDIKEIPMGIRLKDKLILKPKNIEELMELTRDDNG
ncbi:MAG: 4Fe-4S dicluster domain-containing protein [Nitrososphaerales archaeon]